MRYDANDLAGLLELARRVADLGGAAAMRHFRRGESWLKADGTVATPGDAEAEQIIRSEIARAHPDSDILGEEFGGADRGIAGAQWVIDPIDGTAWYALGLPLFGTLVALLVDREPVLGVIRCPALGETTFAARGSGCWTQRDGESPREAHAAGRACVRDATISIAGLSATDIGSRTSGAVRIGGLVRSARRVVTAGDCVQHALVAAGRLDAAIDAEMQPWDIAALVPCILEAGGAVGTVLGDADGVVFSGSLISASGSALLHEIVAHVRPVPTAALQDASVR